MIRVLEDSGYGSFYALEYEHDPWMNNDKVDVISESIRMRSAVRPLLEAATSAY